MDKRIKVDFHCHSSYSPDSINELPELIRLAKKRGLDRLVITDHNCLRGALAAKNMDPDFIIVGEEIMTDRGEILAAFVQKEIPRGLEPKKVIGMLREQGAFISVSHPFDPHRGWKKADLMEIKDQVDAVEIFNGRCNRDVYNQTAVDFAKEFGLGGTAGSDAHIPHEVGKVGLVMPDFNDGEGLKIAARNGVVEGKLAPGWVHIISGTKHKIFRWVNPKK